MKLFFTHRLQEDKRAGFTLAEALFTVTLLAILIVAMAPFSRSVYTAWRVGDRKTEMQQNARVGLDVMTRLLRQTKRITGIPQTGSGNFVKLRDAQDNQTIAFFHNIPACSYYIGNTSLIKDNDLVMRTIDNLTTTNALLSKALSNFTMDFKQRTGQSALLPYNVDTIDISMTLTDYEGVISDTVDVFSRIAIRPEVRIDKPTWATSNNTLTEISSETLISGFSTPYFISINSVFLVLGRETVWVADTGNNRVLRLRWNGSSWVSEFITGFSSPSCVSVNPQELVNLRETCWVADTNNNRICRIYWNGSSWAYDSFSGTTGNNRFLSPSSVSVNPNEIVNGRATCWMADTGRNRIRRIYWTGTAWSFDTVTGFSSPRSVSVNPNEIVNARATCWVADTGGNRVRKIYWTGAAYTYTNLAMGANSAPISVSVNTADGTCWVANSGTGAANGNRVRKLSGPGTGTISILFTVTGFLRPNSVSVNPNNGECWVADTGNNQIVRLDAEGNEEFRISGFQATLAVASVQ